MHVPDTLLVADVAGCGLSNPKRLSSTWEQLAVL